MNVQYMTSSELKTRAKDLLDGRFGSAILIMFLGGVFNTTVTMTCNSFLTIFQMALDISPVASAMISLVVSTVIYLFNNIFSAGYALFFLNTACKRSCDIGCLFYGFRWQFQKCLTLSGFFSLFTFIITLPLQFCKGMYQQTQNVYWMMAYLLFASVSIVAGTVFSLVFSQCYFLLLDFPDYTAGQLLKSSMQIMKGHMGRLFYIQVSFIPLIILALLTCGIGMLWLNPYMHMTYTCFFLDLMNPKKTPAQE